MVLIADKFLFEYNTTGNPNPLSEEQEIQFKRLANASVVIPKRIGLKISPAPVSNAQKNVSNSSKMLKELDKSIAKSKIKSLRRISENFQHEYDNYERLLAEEREVFVASNLKSVINSSETQRKAQVKLTPANGDIVRRPLIEPKFVPSTEFDSNYIRNNVDSQTLEFFEKNHLDNKNGIESIKTSVSNKIQDLYNRSFKSIRALKPKRAVVNGTRIDLDDLPANGTCAFKFEPIINETNKYALYVTQYFSNDLTKATAISCRITNSNFGNQSDDKNVVSVSGNNFVTFELFSNGITIADPSESFDIEIDVTLTSDLGPMSMFESAPAEVMVTDEVVAYPESMEPTEGELLFPVIPLYGVNRLGVSIFRRIEQELCGYVEGEVSHIENIMAREYKERSTRNLTRSEVITTEQEENERDFTTDTSSTDRYEMNSEIQKTLEESRSNDYGISASASGGLGGVAEFSVDAFANFSSASASSESNSQAVSIGKDITEQVVNRIVSKVTKARTSIMVREFEENNTHGFDNRDGVDHVTGVYRWVDKIYLNNIVNYGSRTMYEFMLPEPSLNFKDSIRNVDSIPSNTILVDAPVHPSEFAESPEELNINNYAEMAGEYDAQVEEIPMYEITVAKSMSETATQNFRGFPMTKSANDLIIPEGYYCDWFKVYGKVLEIDGEEIGHGWPYGTAIVGGKPFGVDWLNFEGESNLSYNIEGTLPISVSLKMSGGFNLNVVARCKRKDSWYKKWQLETYNTIIRAYHDKVELYNSQMENAEQPGVNELTINPAFSRKIEIRELKRMAIELIAKPFGVLTSRNNYLDPALTNNINKIDISEQFERHASHVKFLEQAVDWDLMAYKFYPYYYADESKWHNLMNTSNNADPLFQAFLQSGMAKVVVPARLGFEQALNFYLDTGIIWNGQGFALEHDDDLYLSIEEELQKPEYTIDETWTSQIPTSLTILQAKSAALIGEGLPKSCDIADTLAQGDSILGVPRNSVTGGADNSIQGDIISFVFKDFGLNFLTADSTDTIGDLDTAGAFPITYKVMNNDIVIHRSAAWSQTDTFTVILLELIDRLSQIPGITASQYIIAQDDWRHIRFVLDMSVVPDFSFSRPVNDPILDILTAEQSGNYVRIAYYYSPDILDNLGVALEPSEQYQYLPIERFKV